MHLPLGMITLFSQCVVFCRAETERGLSRKHIIEGRISPYTNVLDDAWHCVICMAIFFLFIYLCIYVDILHATFAMQEIGPNCLS